MQQKPQGSLYLCEILEPYTSQAEGAAAYPREVSVVLCPPSIEVGAGQRPELSTHRAQGWHRALVRFRCPGPYVYPGYTGGGHCLEGN